MRELGGFSLWYVVFEYEELGDNLIRLSDNELRQWEEQRKRRGRRIWKKQRGRGIRQDFWCTGICWWLIFEWIDHSFPAAVYWWESAGWPKTNLYWIKNWGRSSWESLPRKVCVIYNHYHCECFNCIESVALIILILWPKYCIVYFVSILYQWMIVGVDNIIKYCSGYMHKDLMHRILFHWFSWEDEVVCQIFFGKILLHKLFPPSPLYIYIYIFIFLDIEVCSSGLPVVVCCPSYLTYNYVFVLRYGDQIVAIKVLKRGDTTDERAALESRFVREVAMMSKVKHENLVKVSITLCLCSFYLDVLMVFQLSSQNAIFTLVFSNLLVC